MKHKRVFQLYRCYSWDSKVLYLQSS